MKKILKHENFIIYIFLILCTLIVTLPIFGQKMVKFQTDTSFHLARLQGLENYFSSPVNFTNFGNQGKMANIFYPPITLLPIQIVQLFTKNYEIVFKFTWFVISLITVFISYFSMNKITSNKWSSLLFAILWTFAVSRVNKQLYSNAISNVYSMAFIPLVFVGLDQIILKKSNKFWYLTISLTLIIYTHIMTFVLLSYFILIMLVILIIFKKLSWNIIKNLFYALFVTVILTLVVFVPILEQMKQYEIFTVSYNPNLEPYSIISYFKLVLTNNDGIGIIGLITFIIILINFKKLELYYKVICICAFIFWLITLGLIPSQIILKLPLLKNIQFYQRFFTLINFVVLFVFAINLEKFKSINKIYLKFNKSYLMFFSLILVVSLGLIIQENQINNDLIQIRGKRVYENLINEKNPAEKLFYLHMDYTNKGYFADKTFLPSNLSSLTNEEKITEQYKKDYVINEKIIKPQLKTSSDEMVIKINTTKNNEFLSTPQSVYKGLNVLVNNKEVQPKLSKYHTLGIFLKNKGNNVIKLKYFYTKLTRILQIQSVISWIILILFIKFKNSKF